MKEKQKSANEPVNEAVERDAAISAAKEAILAKVDARFKEQEKAIAKLRKYSIGYRIAKLFGKG